MILSQAGNVTKFNMRQKPFTHFVLTVLQTKTAEVTRVIVTHNKCYKPLHKAISEPLHLFLATKS